MQSIVDRILRVTRNKDREAFDRSEMQLLDSQSDSLSRVRKMGGIRWAAKELEPICRDRAGGNFVRWGGSGGPVAYVGSEGQLHIAALSEAGFAAMLPYGSSVHDAMKCAVAQLEEASDADAAKSPIASALKSARSILTTALQADDPAEAWRRHFVSALADHKLLPVESLLDQVVDANRALLWYFRDSCSKPTGNPTPAGPYSRVHHPKFGDGYVVLEDRGKSTVTFGRETKLLTSQVLQPRG